MTISEKLLKELNRNPVLFKNKAFSPSHFKPKISSRYIKNLKITTDNVIPVLKDEAESEERTKEIIESSYKAVEKQRSKKKRWLSFAFLMINFAVLAIVIVYQVLNEQPVSIADLIWSKINWWWLIIGVLLFMAINFLDAARISLYVKKATGRFRPFLSYKSVVTCRFYDNMTPLATGGQPFQIYYLSKRGINASTASSIPLAKYVVSQVVALFFFATILILNAVLDITAEPTLLILAWIGLTLNLLLIFAVFMLSVSKRVAPRITIRILKLGYKMRLVKDYRATYRKIVGMVQEYNQTFRMLMKNGWLALWQFILSIAFLFASYTIPFVVYCIFNPYDPSVWFNLFVLQVVCDLALGFIPIPGGAGGAEISFGVLFQSYFKTSGGIFLWAMLFWRFFTYYAYLLQGALLLLYDFLIGNRKIKPLLKRFEYEDKRRKDLNTIVEDIDKKSNKKPKRRGGM